MIENNSKSTKHLIIHKMMRMMVIAFMVGNIGLSPVSTLATVGSDEETIQGAHKHQSDHSDIRVWQGSEKEANIDLPVKGRSVSVDSKSIAETNVQKLNPTLSSEEVIGYSETLPDEWKAKQIRQVLYYSNEGYHQIVRTEMYDSIKELKIIYDDESSIIVPLQESDESKRIEGVNFPILEREKVGDESSESYQYLLKYFKEVHLDEILEVFGGRQTYASLFPDYWDMSLGGLQIGDDREIDSAQLDENFDKLQGNPEETIANILYTFPELTETTNMTSEEKGNVLSFVQENKEELIFAYTYLKRWFNYEVGNVSINEIIYGNASAFNTDQGTSNLEALQNMIEIFKSKPYFISSYYIDYIFFTSNSSLMRQGKGFDIDEIQDNNNMYTMGSLIEYFIRIYEGPDTDYNGWLKEQGFVIGEADIDERVGIENLYLPTWEALRSFEYRIFNEYDDMEYRSTSGAFLTILLSVPDRSGISISNGANGIAIGNTTLLRSDQNKSAEEYARQYAEDQTRFMEFLWDQSLTDNDRKLMMQKEANEGYRIRYDAGERVEGKWEKDVYSTESTYLHYYLMAASPQCTSLITLDWVNGIVDWNNTLVMVINPLSDEYTAAHEVTHVYQHILNSGYDLRLDIETPAYIAQTDPERLTINYYFESEGDAWNKTVPRTEEELKSYAQGYLDAIYAWNIEKAKTIFSMDLDDQVGKVYQGFNNSSAATAKQLSKSEIEKMEIDVHADDFLEKLIEYNIVLPADTKKSEIPEDSFLMIVQDAFFFIPYEEGERRSSRKLNGEDNGAEYIWMFEAMANRGMDGYVDFVTTKLARTDTEIIRTFSEDNLSPEEYLLNRYTEVEGKVNNNQLKLYTNEELSKLVSENIDNDKSAKINFVHDYMERTNNFFDDIYHESNEPEEGEIDPPEVVDPEETEGKLTPDSGNVTGQTGALTINYVSNFDFGEVEYSIVNGVIQKALLDVWLDEAGKEFRLSNMVQVTDLRSKNPGWTLKVTQESQFRTIDNAELRGATITFKDGITTKNHDGFKKPDASGAELEPGVATPIAWADAVTGEENGAAEIMGKGSSAIIFGGGVELYVPIGTSVVLDEAYTTKLTWTLEQTPKF